MNNRCKCVDVVVVDSQFLTEAMSYESSLESYCIAIFVLFL